MPIISKSQDEKKKEREIKRKKNAKIVACLWGAGCVVSSLVFFLASADLGILLAVFSSSVPAVVNLVDD